MGGVIGVCFALDLPNPFPGKAELFADLFKRVRAPIFQAKAQA